MPPIEMWPDARTHHPMRFERYLGALHLAQVLGPPVWDKLYRWRSRRRVMADDEGMFNLTNIMKIAGSVPILLGTMIIFNPTGSLVNGDELTDSGIIVGRYVGMLAIVFGLSHWVVSMYTTENLHIFARFFAIGHMGIGGMDMWNYFLGNVEYDAASIVGSIFPFALAIILLMNSTESKPNQVE